MNYVSRQTSGDGEMFKAKDLENAIKAIIEKKLGTDKINAPLLDPLGDKSCKTIVFTIARDHANSAAPTKLRTYKSRVSPSGDCTIWQAAMATSATPPFFPPIPLTLSSPIPVEYIDPGIGFNNPSRAILTEAGTIWGDTYGEMDFNQEIGFFLSLGTGLPKVARLDHESVKNWISIQQIPLKAVEVLGAIARDCEKTHNEIPNHFLYKLQIYHRFNVEQGLQETQLFEHKKLGQVQADTNAYLDKKDNEAKITSCVEQMSKLHVKEQIPTLDAHEFE